MSNKLNIEQLVYSNLGEAEVTPSPGMWKGIQRKLRWRQFLRFNPGQFNIYYLAGLIIAATWLVVILSTKLVAPAPLDPVDSYPGEVQQGIIPEQEQEEPTESTDDAGSVEDYVIESVPSEILPADQEYKVSEDVALSKSESEKVLNDTEKDTLDKKNIPLIATVETSIPEPVFENQSLPAVVSIFTSSAQSGCAPLEVQFYNQSVNAVSYSWDFGMNGQSSTPDPIFIFEEPGNYTVTLSAKDEAGQSSIHQETIEVFPVPTADFVIEEGFVGVNGYASLVLLNYSIGAIEYSWNLLGKDSAICNHWSSDDFQPPLKLTDVKNGAKKIRLIATNESGCMDEEIRALPIHVESSDVKIKFATAFSPNPTGPGDGAFSPHEKRIDLFHPVFLEVPVEYHLVVYTKRGELVFETREVYQGWDGYFHEERSAGGVYVWMLEGTWINGEAFKKQGDVTLIWQDFW